MEELEIFTTQDVMDRYKCGLHKAQQIIRETKNLCNGGLLGRGRVTGKELAVWEKAHGLS